MSYPYPSYPNRPPPGPPPPPVRHRAGFAVALGAVIIAGSGFVVGMYIELFFGVNGDVNHKPALYDSVYAAVGNALSATAIELGLAIVLLMRAGRHQHRSARATNLLMITVLIGLAAGAGLWAWLFVLNSRYGA